MAEGNQIISCDEFNFKLVSLAESLTRPVGNQRTRKRREYIDLVCAFDIETSYIEELDANILYIWQFQVDEIVTVYGRTWEQFIDFVEKLSNSVGERFLVVYIHNASYEWQFLRSLFDFKESDVFLLAPRRVLKFDLHGNIECRCSYRQTNMSLSQFTNKMGVEAAKLSGEDFDYDAVRYPWTELTPAQMQYCVNDVKGLVQAIKKEMQIDGDTLYTIPLTSTGYVRRDMKEALRPKFLTIRDLKPSYVTYTLLREAFRGGNTHANRYASGYIFENVKSYDRASSYPDVQMNCLFPMTPFRTVHDTVTYDQLMNHYIGKRGYAVLARVGFKNVKLKDKFCPCPYIPRDKVRNIEHETRDIHYDNGRIISAKYFEMTVTDIDLKIIESQYDFDGTVLFMQFAHYGVLPVELKDTIRGYFENKTKLKGDEENKIYYDKAKALLNSIYGCSAQDPAKLQYVYTDHDYKVSDKKTPAQLLADSNTVMPYQWGVWTTAHARNELQKAIDLVGHDFIYADTDSVKFNGEHDFTELNNYYKERSLSNGAYADDRNGKRHYMGVFEYECKYQRFMTMGAKLYAYELDDKLAITIAGVPKKQGAEELKRRGGLDALALALDEDLGGGKFTFHDGVTVTKYNDDITPFYYKVDGKKLLATSNLTIRPNAHEIGPTSEYASLIKLARSLASEEEC
ncbi:MAG: hypothetical protein J6A00_06475 [Bacteroides sp.]|nr:hypothetical protein [Bacteroides sp.]